MKGKRVVGDKWNCEEMTYLNSIEDYENRLSLLTTLLDTSEGKVVS